MTQTQNTEIHRNTDKDSHGIQKYRNGFFELFYKSIDRGKMPGLIYEELSYKLNGIAYQIFKELGPGLREKIYADAFEVSLEEANLLFEREVHCPIVFKRKKLTGLFFDFMVENKIVIELKTGSKDYYQAFDQLKNYLILSGLKLGMIIRFTENGVMTKRIINIKG